MGLRYILGFVGDRMQKPRRLLDDIKKRGEEVLRSMSLERVAGQSNSACPQGNVRLKMKTDLAVHCKGEVPSRRDILEIGSFQGCTNPKELEAA